MSKKRGNPNWANGKSGNPKGRKPGKSEFACLKEAIKKVESRKKQSLYEHAVERAFVDDKVLVALINKLVPNTHHVGNDEENPFKFVIEDAVNINKKSEGDSFIPQD